MSVAVENLLEEIEEVRTKIRNSSQDDRVLLEKKLTELNEKLSESLALSKKVLNG